MDRIATERFHLAPCGEGYSASTAAVMGRVTLGRDASIWYGAVLRGDDDAIRVGPGSNVQDNAVVHALPGIPLEIGAGVTVGHGAILHLRSIGDHCLIGMGAILLGAAEIGAESIVAAGAVVKEKAIVPPRSLVAGVPARVMRAVTEDEVALIRASAREYVEKVRRHLLG